MSGSLQQKNNTYYAVFRLENKKQKWVNLGIPTTRGNKRKAEQALQEVLNDYSEHQDMFTKIKFADYLKSWLEKVKNHVDIVTYEGYHQYATKHIIPFYEKKDIALQDVRISDIEDYYNYKAISGRLDGKSGGLALRSIKLHSVVLNLALKQALYEHLIKENPCVYAKFPNISAVKRETNYYTVKQCNDLLGILKGMPLYEMVYITFIYGLRRSEMMGLKWNAIDFEKNTISICSTTVLSNKVVHKDKTKNSTSKRVYPLLPDIKVMLEKLLERQTENKKIFGNCYCDCGYIFVKEDGIQYYTSYPTHELSKVLKKHNLPHIRWHDLRHSCASMLIDKGWHMKDISDWLGHSDIGTTMNIYGHISMEHKQRLSEGLSNLFSK